MTVLFFIPFLVLRRSMNVYLDYVSAAFLSVSAVCGINNSKHAAPARDGRAGQTALVAELRGVRWSTNGQAISGHQLEPAIILTQIFTRIPPTNYKTILEGEDNGLDNLKCSYSMVSNVVMYMHLKD